ncbi:hypothetical protein CYMTET_27699 [Cymbomonas tetramitiformis]|uniref:Uncharacterized protein n=1 Tax=Cymbomonas tetramitiformis TaxID=36881 RepID=A0AAE0FQU8_9CHLO|nr:hypothetical protein CYMTET_27699 [Cymbomonas tetramitiformis]
MLEQVGCTFVYTHTGAETLPITAPEGPPLKRPQKAAPKEEPSKKQKAEQGSWEYYDSGSWKYYSAAGNTHLDAALAQGSPELEEEFPGHAPKKSTQRRIRLGFASSPRFFLVKLAFFKQLNTI